MNVVLFILMVSLYNVCKKYNYLSNAGKNTEGSTDPVICEQLAPAPAIIDRREPETGDDMVKWWSTVFFLNIICL